MVELLAPVGNFEGLSAALKAGAHSIYFGIKGLNMRSASAKNFDIEDVPNVVALCHAQQVKCYLTLNTVVYNHEFPRLFQILDAIKQAGVDAIIATDFGVIQAARERDIEVHISTQSSIANVESAKFFAQFSPRLVLARECTLAQIKHMKDTLRAQGYTTELEVFVHGALCVAESGRCFMSQFHNRLSANRGQCLQECRRSYKIIDVEEPRREFILDNQYVMSPKDLCTLPILDKLVEAGIDVFKIEGRAKGPEYIYTVTKVYKEALDAIENKTFTQQKVMAWLEELSSVYNRGFTDNFMLGTPTNDSWAGIYGSKATHTKLQVGVITNYYKQKKVAEAVLTHRSLSVGDHIIITGPTTGYVKQKIVSLKTDEGDVESAQKTTVTFACDELVRAQDMLYVWVEPDRQKEAIEQTYGVHTPFKTSKV
ncbi:MAG: peptidase U32 family protein [Candidatus Woesearchaeota archaeon]